jgi:hypothetical protein
MSRSANAGGIIDRSDKGERGQLADAWDGHQPMSGRRGSCHTSHEGVDRGDAVITAVRAGHLSE